MALKKPFLYFIAGFLAMASVGPVQASDGAVVIFLKPPASVIKDNGGFQNLHLGQSLPEGAHIKTGENGRVFLKFSDGSELRLGINTEMVLKKVQSQGQAHNTLLNLLGGFARALVTKLQQGSSFEIGTPNATAAVKGTDFETGFEGGHTLVKVFEAARDSGVVLADLNHEKELLVKENQVCGFGANGFDKLRELTQQEKQDAQKMYGKGKESHGDKDEDKDKGKGDKGNGNGNSQNQNQVQGNGNKQNGNSADNSQGQSNSNSNGQGQGSGNTNGNDNSQGQGNANGAQGNGSDSQNQGQGSNNLGVDTSKLINDAISDLGNKLQVDNQKNAADRLSDATSGKTFVDRHGYLVETSSYVVMPNPATVGRVFITQRQQGPEAGNTYFEDRVSYNRAFQNGDWMSVVFRPISDSKNVDPNTGLAIYYPTEHDLIAQNQFGSSLAINTSFDASGTNPFAPDYGGSNWAPPSVANNFVQNFSRVIYVNHVGVANEDWGIGAGNQLYSLTQQYISTSIVKTSDQGWSFNYYEVVANVSNTLVLTETVYLLDGLGNIQNPDAFLSQPSSLNSFAVVNQPLNFNVSFTAPQLGSQEIDVVLPYGSMRQLF